MRILHYSQMNPETKKGGVAVFGNYLRAAIPKLEFISYEDISNVPQWEMTRKYGLDASAKEDVVIADGYFGLGLAGKVKKLITVCHGTYAGWLRDWIVNPIEDKTQYQQFTRWLHLAAEWQEKAYKQADIIVSVSSSAQSELMDFYGLESELILNGIDVDQFQAYCPIGGMNSIVAVDGGDPTKGADIIFQLKTKGMIKIDQLGFEGTQAERWAPYDVVVMPSRHEGGSYAQLEAMAAGKKIVAYRTGFFDEDVPDEYFWGTWDYYWGTFMSLIEQASSEKRKDPSEWVRENASLSAFQEAWKRMVYNAVDGD